MTIPPAEATPMNDSTQDVHSGGCSAWPLPADKTCAAIARSRIKKILTVLGLHDDLIYDVAAAVSELAANGYEHAINSGYPTASDAVPPQIELWIYHRLHPESELVFRIFDPVRGWKKAPYPSIEELPADAEHGRGLQIVGALFGQWVAHLSRSRLSPWPIAGKVVGFSVPIAGLCAQPPHLDLSPTQAARELARQLLARGIDGLMGGTGAEVSLVSVLPELNFWCYPAEFRWQDQTGTYLHRALTDLIDVTEEAVRRHEEIDVFGSKSKTE
ncbi:MAG: putative anti-sigma regulatory factor, serine/threonine protein kinase [Massilia sp.]|nr:putative anti-sigma regulatory factor, serine/threonine protein kinase [Massilia sp.]